MARLKRVALLCFSRLAVGFALGLSALSLAGESGPHRPPEMVDLTLLLNEANYDIRYAGENNFVGTPIAGYKAPKCLVHISVAHALIRASEQLKKHDLRFKFFDCYRPQKAVQHFMRWAVDLEDTKTKTEYYPKINKNQLVGEYIAQRSGHSRGYTIDVTLERQSMSGEFVPLDMGSPYDFFDTISNTADNRVSLEQKKNRYLLLGIMRDFGFRNYPKEWWHFTFKQDPEKTYFDFDIE